jgi:protein TonB
MKNSHRSIVFFFVMIVLAALAACGTSTPPQAPAPAPAAQAVTIPLTPIPAPPPTRTLDAYKTDVARHVMQRNPERVFEGELPPMLPAVVVLNITVDRAGQLADVQVQRSRDQGASEVALASLRRSGPLPPPDGLGPAHADLMTFSETFLFGERYRFQLRTLAGPQRAGL